MYKHLRAGALLLAAMALSGFPGRADAAGCLGVQLGQVPMVPVGGHVVVPVRFGTDPWSMILDTGANDSALFREAVTGEKLPVLGRLNFMTSGAGGVRRMDVAEVPSFNFDGFALKSLAMPIIDRPAPKFDILPVAGLLGTSIISAFDLDIDFPGQTMILFSHPSCDEISPPWTGHYSRVKLVALPDNLQQLLHDDVASSVTVGNRGAVRLNQASIMMDVQVNGRTLRALVDTGATATTLTPDAATTAGVAAAPKPQPTEFYGMDGHKVSGDLRTARELRIGDAVFQNVPVLVAPVQNVHADMVLGLAALRPMRVWISFATKQMFFQPSDSKP